MGKVNLSTKTEKPSYVLCNLEKDKENRQQRI